MMKILIILLCFSISVFAEQKVYNISNKGNRLETTNYETDSVNWQIVLTVDSKEINNLNIKDKSTASTVGVDCKIALEMKPNVAGHFDKYKNMRLKTAQCKIMGQETKLASGCFDGKKGKETVLAEDYDQAGVHAYIKCN